MGAAIFVIDDDLRRIAEHAKAAGQPMLLVKDQGIYLMSSGLLRPDNPAGKSGHLVAYAEGCDPRRDDEDWYDRALDIAGGDDFGEEIDMDLAMTKFIEGGSRLIFEISETHFNIRCE